MTKTAIKPVDVVIVGAQKAGTTSLFQYLKQHPQIASHPQQEMTYFVNHAEYEKGYDAAFARYFSEAAGDDVLMSKHVMIMHSKSAVDRLYEHNPNAYLIMVLRNPVDRAYSAYWYGRRMGWEAGSSFEDALRNERNQVADDNAIWFDRRYVENGRYMQHIERILKRFPRNHVHVVLHDDVIADPVRVCSDLFGLLNIDPGFEPDVSRRHNVAAAPKSRLLARAFAGFLRSPAKRLVRPLIPDRWSYRLRYGLLKINEKPFVPPSMDESTRKQLQDEFHENNMRLAEFLGKDLTAWDR